MKKLAFALTTGQHPFVMLLIEEEAILRVIGGEAVFQKRKG
jgi:hypothetical protein